MSLPDPTDPLGLAGFVNNADMSDVVMIVGGQKIFAHRLTVMPLFNVLGSFLGLDHLSFIGCCLANLKKVAQSCLLSSWKGKSKEVVLKDEIITPEDFLLFLKFVVNFSMTDFI